MQQKGLVVVAIPLIALISSFTSSYVLNRQQDSAQSWIDHSAQVNSQIQALRDRLVDADTGVRSRLLGSPEEIIESYRAARSDVPELLVTLAELVKDNSSQGERLRSVSVLVRRDLELLAALVRIPAGIMETAPVHKLVLQHIAIMSDTRAAIDAMQREEDQLMRQRLERLKRVEKWGSLMDAVAVFLGLLGGMVAVSLFGNGIVLRLLKLQENTQRVARELPLEPWNSGQDEIGALARDLTLMSDLLSERRRKSGEEARQIRQSETLYRTLARNYPNGSVFLFDSELRFLVADGQGLLDHGPAQQSVEGKTLYEAFSTETVAILEPLYVATLRGEALTREIPYGRRLYQFQSQPVRNESGEIYAGMIVTQDTTERSLAEEELREARLEADRANQAKSEFLSRMSHELRTPLNAILGFGQLLELADLPAKQHESVAHIIEGGRHLLGLVNEVLDLAGIEAGRLCISPEPVRVAHILEEAVSLINPLAQQRGIHIRNDVPQSVGARHIRADRQRLRQTLLNLLSNAVKYNRDAGRVIVSCEVQPGEQLRLKVADTGSGIAPSELARLFVPFERLQPENSAIQGTGLGLAVSKRLVELMGGALGVESIVAQGSTFWIDLPLVDGPVERLERAGQSIVDIAAASKYERPCTVLYIEDNVSNLALLEKIFMERPQVRLLSAMDGRQGLELAREQQPDLILLDLQLPGLSGDKVLACMKADPSTARIPVVMISADATPGQRERLIAGGARAYLSKPFALGEFLRLVDELLTGRKEGGDHADPVPAKDQMPALA